MRLKEADVFTDSGLADKIVFVTGGSRGIGRATVELLAAEGADVTFCFRSDEAAAQTLSADLSGLVHCLDARTGKVHWVHDQFSAIWASPVIGYCCESMIRMSSAITPPVPPISNMRFRFYQKASSVNSKESPP